MKKGLTPAGLGNVGSVEQLVRLAAAYRFDAVDVDMRALTEGPGVAGAAELLRRHRIAVGAFGLPVQWRTTEEQFRAELVRLPELAAAARAVGCSACCTYVLPSTDEPAARFMAVAIRRLKRCAQLLGAYGIRLGLEFVGPHHLRTRWKHPFIWTMADTLEMIESIGEPNVGLLLDSYHWYTTGLGIAELERLRPEQIVHVHLNDAPSVPVEQALDNGRLLPGEGVIDLVGFLAALDRIGYRGVVALEVLTAHPPQEPPEALARRSADQYDRLFAAAGLGSGGRR